MDKLKGFQDELSFTIKAYEPKKSSKPDLEWVNPKLSLQLERSAEFSKKKLAGLADDKELANLLEIPIGQLYFILYGTKENRYKSFTVKKRSGKERIIESPCSSIDILQKKVKPLIEDYYKLKKPVHGFVGHGRSIVSNAEKHKKKNYVLNLDLKDFFHSINFGRVQGIFRNPPFNMGLSAATVLAQLCTYNKRLPQGACTSPVLSNLASVHLDKNLIQIAKKYHLTYTRYADDITFSSNKPFSKGIVTKNEADDEGIVTYEVGHVLEAAIRHSGFEINDKKTRLQHKSQRQEVTGLIVNDGVNINRKFIRKTRAMINEWRKNLFEAEKRFIKSRYHVKESDIDTSKLDGQIYKRAVYGHLSFIRMVKGEEHSPYLSFCKQVLELDPNPPEFIKKMQGMFDMYDVFICHASEDKELVARPLSDQLESIGVKSFLDEKVIKWGDSIVGKINTALQKSRYVVAILSEDSIKKSWPMKELNAVLSSEIKSGKTKILPIIVGNSEEIIKSIPLIEDKLFEEFDDNIEDIAKKIKELLTV